jgi:hypothetical protein
MSRGFLFYSALCSGFLLEDIIKILCFSTSETLISGVITLLFL